MNEQYAMNDYNALDNTRKAQSNEVLRQAAVKDESFPRLRFALPSSGFPVITVRPQRQGRHSFITS